MAGYNLIPAFFNALGSNISESEKARQMGQQQADQANQQPGYQYQQSPMMDRSNFEAGSPATTGANLIGDFGGMGKQLFGKAVAGEADMYSPQIQTGSGFAVQPTDYSSQQAPYQNSGLMQYLGYLQSRGGY